MMCEQSIFLKALETQKGNGGFTDAQMAFAKAQTRDYQKMESRMAHVEKDVSAIKIDVAEVKTDVGTVKTELSAVKGILERVSEKLDKNMEKKAWVFDGVAGVVERRGWLILLIVMAILLGGGLDAVMKVIGLN